MSLIEADELIRRIKADFPLEPLPQTYGQPTWDGEDVDACFAGKCWGQITAEFLNLYSREQIRAVGACVGSMTDEAFCYYSPAFMCMFFGNDYEGSRWLFEHWLLMLDAYSSPTYNLEQKDKTLDQRRLQCFSGFTENQKRDIADFLYHQTYFEGRNLYLNGTYNQYAKSAFYSYWHQFASAE